MWTYRKDTVFTLFFKTWWLKSSVKTTVFMHVNIMTMPVCAVQLPVGHAVLHGILKVSVEVKEVTFTQHTAISLRRERNLSTLCSRSTLVTQAPSGRCTHTHTQSQENTQTKTSHVTKWVRGATQDGKVKYCVMLCLWLMWLFEIRRNSHIFCGSVSLLF